MPAVNLLAILVAVAVMWWRVGQLETRYTGILAAVEALQVDVARLSQQLADRP